MDKVYAREEEFTQENEAAYATIQMSTWPRPAVSPKERVTAVHTAGLVAATMAPVDERTLALPARDGS